MFSKLKQRCFLLLTLVAVGLSISLFANLYRAVPVLATATSNPTVESAAELEARGKYFYSIAQFERAADLWQQAINLYEGDILSRARVLSNLALAHSQLGNQTEASTKIGNSWDLLDRDVELDPNERIRVLAQVSNNRGIIQLNQGQAEEAIASWKQAQANYQRIGDRMGIIRTAINQSSAFKHLGLYRRALKSLSEVENSLSQLPDSTVKVAGLKSYGDILHLVSQNQRSREVLEQSLEVASRLELPLEKVQIFLVLGSTYKANNPDRAREFYDRGLTTCQKERNCLSTDLLLQVYLAKLNLALDTENWQQAVVLIPAIEAEFAHLPLNQANINRKINFASGLIELANSSEINSSELVISREEIVELLHKIEQQARVIGDRQAQSYSLGLLGKIHETLEDWQEAKQYTERALVLAQGLNAPEIDYLWQWQLGRIERVLDQPRAIAHYSQAVELLESLSQDLVAVDPDVRYSFRNSVEPVYRQLVSLLLEPEDVSQASLEGAREVIESLQLAELNNFFREACLDERVVKIDNVDPKAAVVYPIILSDRLEVILSLPDRPLKHYSTVIPQAELETTVEQFRHNLVIRSRRNFYRPARKLYDLVIRPALKDLQASQIETIVFVPDGVFRNVPLSALYDGQHYLIEDYSIALTPGLQLLAPRPLKPEKLKTVAAGLTKGIKGFAPLKYVDSELAEIKDTVDSVILLDRDFTSEALYQKIESSDYPIVHIATHGQFSSKIENTFLLAWDEQIGIDELDRILQTRPGQEAIELLVLSACETATGDSQAALGMAGMAVRAGAKSTLATLWSVNDRATAKLMSDFYHQLSEQKLPKAEAVRQAQLTLIENPWYRHPFYWAAYVLLGNWL